MLDLSPTFGHEQKRVRPCVVVSDSEIVGDQKFPLVCVIPITRTSGQGGLYPPLAPGSSGLRKPSFALVDQLRSVDKRRIRQVFGRIDRTEMETN